MLHDKVAHYDDYDGIIENETLGLKFAEKLGDRQILLLKNHVNCGGALGSACCLCGGYLSPKLSHPLTGVVCWQYFWLLMLGRQKTY